MAGLFGPVIGIVIGILVLVLIAYSGLRKFPPNKAAIITGAMIGGGKNVMTNSNGGKYKIIVGGAAYVIPFLQQVNILELQTETLTITTPEVPSKEKVKVEAIGTVVFKIGNTQEKIAIAAEQFLGKSREEINGEAQTILEGHLRQIIGTMTIAELIEDKEAFAQNVTSSARDDLTNMGLDIISFTIKDLTDTVGYIDNMAKPEIAEQAKKAEIAEANAKAEAAEKSAEANTRAAKAHEESQRQQSEFRNATKLRESELEKELLIKEVERGNAEKLKTAELQVQLNIQEAEARKVKEEKATEITKIELQRTIKEPAEANKYAAQMQAEADALLINTKAEAEANQIKSIGSANAQAQEEMAQALAKLTDSGKMQMVIEMLPKLIEANAQSLNKVGNINIQDSPDNALRKINGMNIDNALMQVKDTTGLDLKSFFTGLMPDNLEVLESLDMSTDTTGVLEDTENTF